MLDSAETCVCMDVHVCVASRTFCFYIVKQSVLNSLNI